MTEQNGIRIYDQGEKPQLPEGLTADFDESMSVFGFKIVTVDGKPVAQAASEDDYCNSEAQRLGVSGDEIRNRVAQKQANTCRMSGWLFCSGQCPMGGDCRIVQNPNTNNYYCSCFI